MLLKHVLGRTGASMVSVVTFIVAVTACATVDPNSRSSAGPLTIPVIIRGASGDTLSIQDRPPGATILLGAIPGAIFGDASTPLQMEHIIGKTDFELDFAGLSNIAKTSSATLTPAASVSGWKIEPATTRFIRIATNLNYDQSHSHSPMTAFVDKQTSDFLILAYFDRPCHLTADITEQDGSHDLADVIVNSAGLHWLAATGKASDKTHVIRRAGSDVSPIFFASLLAQ